MQRIFHIFSALIIINSLVLAQPAVAETFTVDIFTDDNDAAPGDGNCAGGPGGCSLRGAIEEANAFPGDDTIMLPEGTFVLDNVGGFPEDAAASGDLDITSNISIVGAGASKTIIDGNASDRVFSTFPADALVVQISNLTVQNGLVESNGGAFYLAGGTITLDGLSVINNHTDYEFFRGATASGCGGAMSLANTQLTVRNSTFSGNSTGDGYDGADGFNPARAGSESGSGGAICAGSGSIQISNSTFANNSTGNGGDGGDNPVAAGANGSDAGVGGALYIFGTADLTLNNVTIAQNTVGAGGADGNGTPDGIAGADGYAAGIFVASDSTGEVRVSNSIIAENTLLTNSDSPNCFGDFISAGHNLLGDSTGCHGFSEDEDDLLGTDPLFDDAGLYGNGGETLTIALLVGSPAIDAGFAEGCEELDQRGVARSGVCDIGAFEYEALCGDAVVQSGEECDDGNSDETDECDNSCLAVEPVGSGSVDDIADDTPAASSGGGCSLSTNGSQASEMTVFAVLSALFGIAYLTRRRCVS